MSSPDFVTAGTPGEALTLSLQYEGPIHLLLLDVVMPEMNGKELKKKIMMNRPDVKTLFMSGYTADVIGSHGVIDEGVAFVQKPFTVPELGTKVREVLDA